MKHLPEIVALSTATPGWWAVYEADAEGEISRAPVAAWALVQADDGSIYLDGINPLDRIELCKSSAYFKEFVYDPEGLE